LYNYSSAKFAYAASVNTTGTAVGAALEPTSGSIVATLWPATGGIQRLSPDDANPSVAVAINRGGTVAGWAAIASGVNHAVIWVPSSQVSKQQSAGVNQSSNVGSAVSIRNEVRAANDGCLTQMHTLGSRQALFACVMEADRAKRTRSR
jgi:hypothetical protein